jgi:cytidylate kinase
MIIAISGKSGCGNTTSSRLVASRLGLRVVNYTFKDLARDMGLSFEELSKKAETDSQYDLKIDRMQVEMAKGGGCVLGSRLAIWLLRGSAVTVYLKADLEVRALRIAKRESLAYETALARTGERDRRDRERYLRLYGFDVDQFDFASFIIETESLVPEEIAAKIIEKAGQEHH